MARHLFPSFLGQTKVLRKASPLPSRKSAQTLTSHISESRKKSRLAIGNGPECPRYFPPGKLPAKFFPPVYFFRKR
nr:hypothetical protein [Bacillaceae bacterium]